MIKTCQSCNARFNGRKHAKTCSVKCRKRLQRTKNILLQEAENLKQAVSGTVTEVRDELMPHRLAAVNVEAVSDSQFGRELPGAYEDLPSTPEIGNYSEAEVANQAPVTATYQPTVQPPKQNPSPQFNRSGQIPPQANQLPAVQPTTSAQTAQTATPVQPIQPTGLPQTVQPVVIQPTPPAQNVQVAFQPTAQTTPASSSSSDSLSMSSSTAPASAPLAQFEPTPAPSVPKPTQELEPLRPESQTFETVEDLAPLEELPVADSAPTQGVSVANSLSDSANASTLNLSSPPEITSQVASTSPLRQFTDFDDPPPLRRSIFAHLAATPMAVAIVTILVLGTIGTVVGNFVADRSKTPSILVTNPNESLSSLQEPGKIVINLDTEIASGKTLTVLGNITGPQNSTGTKILQVAGELQTSGALNASGGSTSLSNVGLKINNNVVCTSRGCLLINGSTPTQGQKGDKGDTGAAGASGIATCPFGDCLSLQPSTPGTQETGNINISGTAIAGNFSGSGANLTSLNGSNISSGTVADARLSGNVTLQGNAFNGTSQLVQTTAAGFLPALNGSLITNLNASNLASGTVADARLSANVTLQGNNFNGASQLVQTTAGGALPVISGVNLTNLDASAISLGTLLDARLSSNVALLSGSQTFTGAPLLQNSVNSTTAFRVQNAAGARLLTVDTSNNEVEVGQASSTTGKLVFYNSAGTGSITIQAADPAAATYTVTLPAATGTVCLTTGNCAGVGGTGDVTQGGNSFGTALTLGTNDNFGLNFETNNTTVASLTNAGAALFKNASNSTSAFQIQNAAGTSNLLIADTVNSRIAIAQATASYTLDVAGDVNTTGTYRINGTAICTTGGCTPASGSGEYVQLQASTPGSPQTGHLNISGTAIAGNFSGSGANLTSLNGSNISSGTVADARLSSNIAKLDGTGPQIFTGNNRFNGTLLHQNAADSTTAFQIQNAAGTSNLFIADTTTNRIGIGLTGPAYNLDVAGDINITGAYRIGGTAVCTSSGCSAASGSGSYIQNQSAADQTADFRISGTGRANTSFTTPNLDTVAAGALGVGDLGMATSVSICNHANCDTVSIATNADADAINIGDSLDTVTITGNSSSSFVLNGLTVTAAELNLLDGHDVALVDTNDAVATAITGTGALDAGSITSGFGTIDNADTITGTTLNGTTGINTGAGAGTQRIDASGNLVNIGTITSGLINGQTISATANFTGTLAVQGASVTAGTASTTDGTIVLQNATNAFTTTITAPNTTISSKIISLPNETGTVCTTGSVCSGYAPATGGSGYIQLQATTPGTGQTGHFNISGTGIVATSLLTPLLDANTAATLNVGTTNATSISLNQNTIISGSKTFGTGTGAVSLNGDTTVASGKTLTANGNALFQTNSDSSSAFQVQNSGGTNLAQIDTTADSTNLVTNGSFEVNTTGWAAKNGSGTSTLTRRTTQKYIGLASMEIATSGADSTNAGTTYNITLNDSTNYWLTFYLRLNDTQPTVKASYSSDGTLGGELVSSCTTPNSGASTSGWVRYSCPITTPGTHSGTPYVFISQSDATNHTYFIDGVKLIQGTTMTPYREGTISLNGNFDSPVVLRNQSDSEEAFQIRDAAGGNLILMADTLNRKIGINGTTSATNTAALQVSGSSSASISLLSPALDVITAGALAVGNTTATSVSLCASAACDTIGIGNAGADADAINIGDSLDTVTITGNSSSSFVLNGLTVTAAELNLLDGHDVALVDTNDAVATAITGTGALDAGSITSGFGTIDNADTITGTTLNGTTGINTGAGAGTQRIDASGNLVNIGNFTAAAGTTFLTSGANGFIFKPGTDNATAFSLQDAGGNAILVADSSTSHLKIYENIASPTNYLELYYDNATTSAIIQASSGTTKVGNGTGPITLSAGSGAAVNITANAASTWQTTAGLLTLQGTDGLTLNSIGSTTLTVDSTTTGGVNVGSGASAKAVTIGNTQTGTTVSVDAGTGASAIVIGNSANAHGIQIGTGAAVQTVTVGSTNTTSTLTLQGGTGATAIQLIQGSGGKITIGANSGAASVDIVSGTGNITLTSNGSSAKIIAKSGTNGTAAFDVQNSSGASLFTADTSGSKLILAGHVKVTYGSAPSIGTPTSCGTTPSAVVTAGSNDTAGSFTVTAGTGSPSKCSVVITYASAYAAAPKAILLTMASQPGTERDMRVSAIDTTTFTAVMDGNAAVSAVYSYYYWVIE